MSKKAYVSLPPKNILSCICSDMYGDVYNIEQRIWALDKNEASLLRSYFTDISTCHEEIDVIVAKKWNIVKSNSC